MKYSNKNYILHDELKINLWNKVNNTRITILILLILMILYIIIIDSNISFAEEIQKEELVDYFAHLKETKPSQGKVFTRFQNHFIEHTGIYDYESNLKKIAFFSILIIGYTICKLID